jgi:hypothetical protein
VPILHARVQRRSRKTRQQSGSNSGSTEVVRSAVGSPPGRVWFSTDVGFGVPLRGAGQGPGCRRSWISAKPAGVGSPWVRRWGSKWGATGAGGAAVRGYPSKGSAQVGAGVVDLSRAVIPTGWGKGAAGVL